MQDSTTSAPDQIRGFGYDDVLDLSAITATGVSITSNGSSYRLDLTTANGTLSLLSDQPIGSGSYRGNFVLTGGTGADNLSGLSGQNRIVGLGGSDLLDRGAYSKRTVFAYNAVSDSSPGSGSQDMIYSFKTGTDQIDASAFKADSLTITRDAGNNSLVDIGSGGQHLIVKVGSSGAVFSQVVRPDDVLLTGLDVRASAKQDSLYGSAGNDRLTAAAAHTMLVAGTVASDGSYPPASLDQQFVPVSSNFVDTAGKPHARATMSYSPAFSAVFQFTSTIDNATLTLDLTRDDGSSDIFLPSMEVEDASGVSYFSTNGDAALNSWHLGAAGTYTISLDLPYNGSGWGGDLVLDLGLDGAVLSTTSATVGTQLFGGGGSDALVSGSGADVLDGGAGTDTASFANAAAGVVVDLVQGTATGDGSDTLRSIENVIGSTRDDSIRAGSDANVLTGGGGNDLFSGTRAELAGDTIGDFARGDRLSITDAASRGFGFTRVGTSVTVGVGQSLTLSNNPIGRLVTGGTLDGPAQLSLANRMTGLGDFDGNGHSDILWREAGGTFSTWDTSGNAQGNQFAVNSTLVGGVGTDWKIQETFDWDGDGRSDMLWRNQNSGEFTIWTGKGDGWAVNAYDRPGIGTNWKIAGVGDLNGDGKDDIVWREANGAFSTWQSTGQGFNVNVDFDTSVSTEWQIVGLGDFNGDGKDDLLWRNQKNGAFSTWASNGTGFTTNTNFVSSVDTSWHIDGLADFNGDSRDDILWRHDGDGKFTEWQSNAGGGFTVNAYVNGSVAPVWQVATTGDYNDDGKADILWRNTADGTFSIWQSNGNGFDPNTAYVNGVGTNWQVQGHNFQLG